MKRMLAVVTMIVVLSLLSAVAFAEAPPLAEASSPPEEAEPERFMPDGPAHVYILENGVNLRAGGSAKDKAIGKGGKGDAFTFVGYADSGWLAFVWKDGTTAYVTPTKAELRLGKAPIKPEKVKVRIDYNKTDAYGLMPLVGEDILFIRPIFWACEAELTEGQAFAARAQWCSAHKLFYDEEAVDEACWERLSVFAAEIGEAALDELHEAFAEDPAYANIRKVSFEGSLEYNRKKKESFEGREWLVYDLPTENAFGGMTLLGDTAIALRFEASDTPHIGEAAYRELGEKIMASVHLLQK